MKHRVGSLEFEWDDTKAEENVQKHGVSLIDAATVFADPLAQIHDDPDHSIGEHRFLLLGQTFAGTLLVVAHAEDGVTIRIISAREATPAERRRFERNA